MNQSDSWSKRILFRLKSYSLIGCKLEECFLCQSGKRGDFGYRNRMSYTTDVD